MPFSLERLTGAARLVWAGDSFGLTKDTCPITVRNTRSAADAPRDIGEVSGQEKSGLSPCRGLGLGLFEKPRHSLCERFCRYWRCTAVISENRPACKLAQSNYHRRSPGSVMSFIQELLLIRLVRADQDRLNSTWPVRTALRRIPR